jgi:phosphohistidine phosphatase SixA
MKKLVFILLLSFAFACQTDNEAPEGYVNFEIPEGEQPKITNYYFIRHAEKDLTTKDDPQLTMEGLERASFWGEFFQRKAIDQFYTTKYMRTFQTIIPIVHHYKKSPETYKVDGDSLFTPDFWKKTYGHNAVVVGHSNTTPVFANEILRSEKYPDINEKQYGNLYHIEIDETGKIKDTLLFFEEFELPEKIRNSIRGITQ